MIFSMISLIVMIMVIFISIIVGVNIGFLISEDFRYSSEK